MYSKQIISLTYNLNLELFLLQLQAVIFRKLVYYIYRFYTIY